MIADIIFHTAVALAIVATPAPVVEPAPTLIPVEVELTAYTCDYDKRNPMTTTPGMCQATATGGDPHQPGIACPASMMGTTVVVPEFGSFICDDTGAHDTLFGRLHLDLRVSTYAEALRIGRRTITVQIPSWSKRS